MKAGNYTFTALSGRTTSPFFKIEQVVARNRIWLNLTDRTGFFSKGLIEYTIKVITGIDDFVAKYFNDGSIALTSNINNEEYTIEGRSSFDVSDVVGLNFKTDVAADITITVNHFNGLSAKRQAVYLFDCKTGAETDLKSSPYIFAVKAGTDNDRFSLKYQKNIESRGKAFNKNSVVVYKKKELLRIHSNTVAITNIKVFVIHGREIAEQKKSENQCSHHQRFEEYASGLDCQNFKRRQQTLYQKSRK